MAQAGFSGHTEGEKISIYGVATSKEVSYKIMYERFAETKIDGLNSEMTILTR